MKKFYSLFVAMFLLFIGAGTAAAQLTIDPGTQYYLKSGEKFVYNDNGCANLTDNEDKAIQFVISNVGMGYTFTCGAKSLNIDSEFGDVIFESYPEYFDVSGTNSSFTLYSSWVEKYIGDYGVLCAMDDDPNMYFSIVPVGGGSGDNSTIPINFALHENGYYYTTFFSSKDWVVPECDGVYVITQIDGNEISLGSPIAHKNDVVKGGTAVLIRSMKSGSSVIKEATSGTPIEGPAGNLLDGTDDDTPNIHADGYVYYILSKADGVPGFYYQKGCTDGSYVNNGAHKAYLRLEKTNGGSSNGFTFRFDDNLTSVQSIATQKKATIYNLQGQRVSGKAAGVYVKNGKKFIVR